MLSFSFLFSLSALVFTGSIDSIEAHTYDTEVTLSLNEPELSFIIIGDWGSDNGKQHQTANKMGKWCEQNKCEFVLALGDNFYGTGVYSNDSERFQTTWSDIYDDPSIADLDWYAIVGNHDHGRENTEDGHEWFQVEHSQLDPRWVFPDLAYSLTVDFENTKVKFVNIDTQSIRHEVNDAEDMLNFLDDQLNDSSVDWKIVSGHHPCYTTTGDWIGDEPIREKVRPIMQQHNTDIYLAGHEHNAQHWKIAGKPKEIDYIITGGGGHHLSDYSEDALQSSIDDGGELKKYDNNYGFTYMTINSESISWRFINIDGEVVYDYTRQKV